MTSSLKARSSVVSAPNALITLMPDRICTRRCITSLICSWRRRLALRMRVPNTASTSAIGGPIASSASASCHESSAAPTSAVITTPRSSSTSPKICDCSRLATAVSLVSRAIASPRASRWCRPSGRRKQLRRRARCCMSTRGASSPTRRRSRAPAGSAASASRARALRARSCSKFSRTLRFSSRRSLRSFSGLIASMLGRLQHVADRRRRARSGSATSSTRSRRMNARPVMPPP